MDKRLDCGHPIQCLREDGEGNEYCAWCDHVEMIRVMAEAAGGKKERERCDKILMGLIASYEEPSEISGAHGAYDLANQDGACAEALRQALEAIREAAEC